jgi:MFS family permease
MFNYFQVSTILLLYLQQLDLNNIDAGYLLTVILIGDVIVRSRSFSFGSKTRFYQILTLRAQISLYITIQADRLGRRVSLIIGAALKLFAGIIFASFSKFWILLLGGRTCISWKPPKRCCGC